MAMSNRGGVSQDESSLIKAIALIMMIYHHFFGFANRMLISNPYLTINIGGHSLEAMIATACKLCVCIFAFLTGYGIYYSYGSKTLWQRLKRALGKSIYIYFAYILTLLLVYLPLAFVFEKRVDGSEFIKNLFLLKTNLLHTSWYVTFYIESVFVLALLYKLFDQHIVGAILTCIVSAAVIGIFLGGDLFLHYFPSTAMGYIFARWKVYEFIYKKEWKEWIAFILGGGVLVMLLAIRLVVGDSIGPISIVTFLAPVFVYELKLLIGWGYRLEKIRTLGFCIAKYSMFYWLIHSVVHCGVAQVQSFIYAPKLSIFIVLWAVVVMTPLAMLLSGLLNTGKRKLRQL